MANLERPTFIDLRFIIAILLSTLVCTNNLFAQDTAIAPVHLNKKYIISYFGNTKNVLAAPFRLNEKSLLAAGTALCLTGGLMIADRDIQTVFQKNRNMTFDNVSRYGLEPWGRGLYSVPLLGVLYIHGAITHNERTERVALLAGQSFLISAAVVQIPKYLIQRHRPYQDIPSNQFLFDGPLGGFKHNSMASGHTIAAFSVASMFAQEYKDKKWVGIVAYSIATLTGLSRIYDNKHWASDVLLGAAMGIGISKVIYINNKKSK